MTIFKKLAVYILTAADWRAARLLLASLINITSDRRAKFACYAA